MKKDKETILNVLLAKSYELKAEYDVISEELKDLNNAIIKIAVFDEDSKTAHLVSEEYEAIITKRIKQVWDQNKLSAIKSELSEKEFDALFKVEIKPVSKKAIDEYVQLGTKESKLINKARAYSDERPSVKVIKKECL